MSLTAMGGKPNGYTRPPLKLSLRKADKLMRKYSEENERIKRHYFQYLREAMRRDQATVDKAADAILKFEASTGFKPFKRFHIDQAMAFKKKLEAAKHTRTGKPLSKATIDGVLRVNKAFIHWLAGQPGYKSRIKYSDAEYFNINAKDARIAHQQRDKPHPTMAQTLHAFKLMPDGSDIERRNKALFALLMLTGMRDGAMASLRLKRVDLVEGCIYQDARDVKTKNAKTFTTWFYPVDPIYRTCFESWVNYIRNDRLFGHEDAVFPKPEMTISPDGGFMVGGLSRDTYANGGKIREVIKGAFTSAGLPAFVPHSFRKTLTIYGDQLCTTRSQFKAWSLNMGHDNIITTLSAYCPITTEMQGKMIKAMVELN